MRAVIQRVSRAKVRVEPDYISEINSGILLLIAIHVNDSEEMIDKFISKIVNLRIFNDENDKMNLSIKDINGEFLIISQFTLYADTKRGNRPSFIDSADFTKGQKLYFKFVEKLSENYDSTKIKLGIFGAKMSVESVNEGPVTIIIDA